MDQVLLDVEREVVDALRKRFAVSEEETDHSPERMVFKLPRELVA